MLNVLQVTISLGRGGVYGGLQDMGSVLLLYYLPRLVGLPSTYDFIAGGLLLSTVILYSPWTPGIVYLPTFY